MDFRVPDRCQHGPRNVVISKVGDRGAIIAKLVTLLAPKEGAVLGVLYDKIITFISVDGHYWCEFFVSRGSKGVSAFVQPWGDDGPEDMRLVKNADWAEVFYSDEFR